MENKNAIMISGVECYEENGVAFLKLENVARGLGFTETAASGNECIRWRTVRKYLADFGIATSCDGKEETVLPDFIPENVFYRLAMKAKNETAEKFQALVADEIIPSIRKTGKYEVKPKLPMTYLEALKELVSTVEENEKLKEENLKLNETNAVQHLQLLEYEPKITYYNHVLQSKEALPISVIAKDYGWTAQKMNEYLKEKKVQFKQGKRWLLYDKYAQRGYTCTKTHHFINSAGLDDSNTQTYWKQEGRLFIYDLLKSDNILPLIEMENNI